MAMVPDTCVQEFDDQEEKKYRSQYSEMEEAFRVQRSAVQ